DGIRDATVTGVQTCALPILISAGKARKYSPRYAEGILRPKSIQIVAAVPDGMRSALGVPPAPVSPRIASNCLRGRFAFDRHLGRSEERRVGKDRGSLVSSLR